MERPGPYQQVLAMVIGLSLLSVLVGKDVIAWVAWGLGFICLAWQDFALALTNMLSKAAAFVFGNLLRLILVIVYLLIITPTALIVKKRNLPGGWKEATTITADSLRRTG
jgi:hypothetical protein